MADKALARGRRPSDAEMLERVVVHNDLSRLSPEQRLAYYSRLCKSLHLNPLSRPFQYLVLNGKLVLYATKDCTEQLRKLNGISIYRMETARDEDTYTVTVYGRDASGREDIATGVVGCRNVAGEQMALLRMKAETKGKRRLTLSLAGLGVLDESEVDDISIGGRVEVDHETGEIQTDLRPDALAESEPAPSPEAVEYAKDELLVKIKTGFSQLKWDRPRQEAVWQQFCPGEEPDGVATFLTAEATVEQLTKLREYLVAEWRDANPTKR